ncbi:peptidylprolyl isomerase [uncultured Sphingomonas sp.]|uniref:peptidylprolyl isomerase n=1 Tax=uncultured Sphingomonas sp. TaxID=158754 RepID=UPI0025E63939|nr:peptidylprolyl isomerase [uncultured Sphingomonas sp.]
MLTRIALALLLPLAAATAQTPAAPAVPAPPAATTRVTLTTAEGPIVLELETSRAPITAGNFLKYVEQKRFDGASFYRAVPIADGYGFIQGGIQNDPKKQLKPIAHEPTTQTGLSHTDGAIAMARLAPGTAASEFFIVVGDLKSMDADPSKPGDNQGFAVFGHVAEGMDLVKRIMLSPRSPTKGDAAMKGQMLAPEIRILTARKGG